MTIEEISAQAMAAILANSESLNMFYDESNPDSILRKIPQAAIKYAKELKSQLEQSKFDRVEDAMIVE